MVRRPSPLEAKSAMDYAAALYDPIYLITGVPVVLTLAEGGEFDALTALDKTSGIVVGETGAQVPTIKPAAAIRIRELAQYGIAVDALPGSDLEMNDFTWHVENYLLRPSPKGENDGEVLLLLSDKAAVTPEEESESESEP